MNAKKPAVILRLWSMGQKAEEQAKERSFSFKLMIDLGIAPEVIADKYSILIDEVYKYLGYETKEDHSGEQ